MTKKFVKTDFKAMMKKDQQPAAPYTRPNEHSYRLKARPSNQFQQRIQTTELRKYFQPVPPSPDLLLLIQKFPVFFTQISLHPQPMRSYKPGNDSYNNFRDKPLEMEEMPDWQSEGEVELGAKISQEIISKVQNIAPISLCELKQYEKEFLEEEMRRKLEEAGELPDGNMGQTEQKTNKKDKKEKKEQEEVKIPAKKREISSDEEVDIKKVIEIHSPPKQQQYNHEPQYVMDDDADDDKFKDSSEGSDDDIFGSGSEKDSQQKEQTKEESKKEEVVCHGQIKCAKGQFSMFALSQGIHEDEKIWSFTNQTGQNVSSRMSSKQMDRDYLPLQSAQYPMICFDPNTNNYIPYALFHSTPDIKFFQTFSYAPNMNSNNYRRKKTNQQEQYKQDNIPKNRKYSNNYKPKQPPL